MRSTKESVPAGAAEIPVPKKGESNILVEVCD